MNRRQFIQTCSLLPMLSAAPGLFAQAQSDSSQLPLLVLIELKGGNDTLNTLIPMADPLYRKLRPKIAIPAAEALRLDDEFSMHGGLQALQPLWQSGDMAWVQGLGYPNPNRSHFRSIEIWETGSESDEYDLQGWITKLYPQEDKTLKGIVLGSDAGPLGASTFEKIIMDNPKTFQALTKHLKKVRAETQNPVLAHVLDVQNNVRENAQSVVEKLQDTKAPDTHFPKHSFGQRLQQAAHLINSGLGAGIYKIELGGFDTHRGQINRHQRLMTQLAGGLSAFSQSMQKAGHWNNVLIMTYSEFGRRAAENLNGGTDHGTAAAHFLLGGRVRGGLHGISPRLDHLVKGDLVYTTDFRSLYHTIATQWLQTSSPWMKQPTLNLIES